jgi:hypothetical protein
VTVCPPSTIGSDHAQVSAEARTTNQPTPGRPCAGQLNIGIQSDPDGLPDLDVFADGLRQSLDELGATTPPLTG